MNNLLGAIPLSPDILSKANIGLWAFELDEGEPPRMYADETMLGLIGLKEQLSPEETYHAWYDNIDAGAYGLVADSVEKMTAGEHAEVQYPWHNPNGETMIVRCGGVRNPEYKKGIRIEGTHQNVTEVLHFEDSELVRIRQQEMELKSQRLRADALAYVADHEPDVQNFLDFFGERILEFSGCDQVIFRDLKGNRSVYNAPGIYDVPQEVCKRCVFSDFQGKAYDGNELILMNDCSRGFKGFSADPMCPAKSSVMQIVYTGGKVVGLLTFHYLREHHEFSPQQLNFLKTLATYLGLLLGRINTKKLLEEQNRLKEIEAQESERIIASTIRNYTTVYVVNLKKDIFRVLKGKKDIHERFGNDVSFVKSMYAYIDSDLLAEDRLMLKKEIDPEVILGKLQDNANYRVEYRAFIDNVPLWHEMYVSALGGEDVLFGFIMRDKSITTNHINKAVTEDYYGIYSVDLERNLIKPIKQSGLYMLDEGAQNYTDAFMTFIRDLSEEDGKFLRQLAQPQFMKMAFVSENKHEYVYFSPRTGDWTKLETRVIKRSSSGEATVVAHCFTKVDSIQRENAELNKKVSEQNRQLEEALSLAQSANRAKTTFLNNMSHDIRTPMNAIIGYTGLAASHIDNKEQVKDYLSKISQSSDHLLSLINDVLDMSRIESGKMNLSEKQENLSEVIHTLRDIVQADIRSKQLEFFIDSMDVNDEQIFCDRLRLNQVLLNVLSNAIKYTQSGGTVSMRITEKALKPNGYGTYEFRIRDNGMGMTEEFLKTIFDPFTRVKSSTVSGIQGTGLGMAITKNIVDMMGGTIVIESAPGKGTEVTMTFDFRIFDGPKAPVKIPEFSGIRSLVVDDDTNACISSSGMLRDIGMRPEWCTSGREALIRTEQAIKEGEPFRVCLLDWLMPDMNGVETARRIRKLAGEDLPIIILTSYDWSDVEEEAREAGVTAFISKPMFPSDLHRVLLSCIGKTEEGKDAAPEEKQDFSGRKILLVEDNELNREIAEEILSEYGFTVTSAADGTEAVETIEHGASGDFDLILMDIQMPVMDGYEATKKIRAINTELSKIPIVAMTANAFEEDRKAALLAGMDEHIAKPISIPKLEKVLSRFLK